MLTVNNLKLKLGRKQILDDISFSCLDGNITVLLGRNGSGKTTLLRALASETLKYDGEVIIDDKNISVLNKQLRAQLVGYLPQSLAKPAISIEELVSFGRYPYHDDFVRLSKQDKEVINSSLEKTGLTKLKEQLVCHLSYGQRQLAYFTLMLAKDSKIMLLDEPTSNLDSSVTKSIYQLLNEMKKKNKCILISMHDINEALEIADNIICLDEGKCVYSGDKTGFIEKQLYKELFGLKKLELTDKNGNQIIIFK